MQAYKFDTYFSKTKFTSNLPDYFLLGKIGQVKTITHWDRHHGGERAYDLGPHATICKADYQSPSAWCEECTWFLLCYLAAIEVTFSVKVIPLHFVAINFLSGAKKLMSKVQ